MAQVDLARLEDAFMQAHNAGDTEAATVLAAEVRRRRTEEPDLGEIFAQNQVRYAAPKETGVFEDLTSGFGAGAVNVGEMASLGAVAILDEEAELAAREKIKAAADYIRPEGGDPESFSYGLGQAFGSIAGIAAPAAIAGVAGAPTLAATGIAGLLGVGASAGEASERARESGATEEERGAATLRGAPIGLLEILPIARFVKSVDLPLLNKLVDKLGPEKVETIGEKIYSAGITGGYEGAQEIASEALQNLNQKEYDATVETFAGAEEAFTYGSIAGGLLDLFLGGSRRARDFDRTPEGLAAIEKEKEQERISSQDRRSAEAQSILAEEQAEITAEEPTATAPKLGLIDKESEKNRVNVRLALAKANNVAPKEITEEQVDDYIDGINIKKGPKKGAKATSKKRKRKNKVERIEDITGQKGFTDEDVDDVNAFIATTETSTEEQKQAAKNKIKAQDERQQAKLAADRGQVTEATTTSEATDAVAETTSDDTTTSDAIEVGAKPVEVDAEATEAVAETTSEATETVAETTSDDTTEVDAEPVITRKKTDAGDPYQLVEFGTDSYEIFKEPNKPEWYDRNDLGGPTGGYLGKNRTEAIQKLKERRAGTPPAPPAALPPPAANTTAATETAAETVTDPTSERKILKLRPGATQKRIKAAAAKRAAADKKAAARITPAQGVPAPTIETNTDGDYPEYTFKFEDGTEYKGVMKGNEILIDGVPEEEFKAFTPKEAAKKLQARQARVSQESQAAKAMITGKSLNAKDTDTTPQKSMDEVVDGVNITREKELAKDAKAVEADRDLDPEKITPSERKELNASRKANKLVPTLFKYFSEAIDVGKNKQSTDAAASSYTEKEAITHAREMMEGGERATKARLILEARKLGAAKDVAIEYAENQVLGRNAGINIDPTQNNLLGIPVKGVTAPLTETTLAALRAGDLKAALQDVAKNSTNPRIKLIANLLSKMVGDTKVLLSRTTKNLPENATEAEKLIAKRVSKSVDGYPVYGFYSRGQFGEIDLDNTIVINEDIPAAMSVHTLLHEMTHAATIQALRNPTKGAAATQIIKLFKDVKGQLKGQYGATDVEEFVAEAFGNLAFHKELSRFSIKGERLNVMQRFVNGIRALFKRPPLKGNASKELDVLIEQLLAPAPQSIGAGSFNYMTANAVGKAVREAAEAAAGSKKRSTLIRDIKGAFSGPGNPALTKAKKIFFRFLPNASIADYAKSDQMNGAQEILDQIDVQRGDLTAAEASTRKTLLPILEWANKATKTMSDRFNNIVYDSTIAEVDPTKDASEYTGKKLKEWTRLRNEYNKLDKEGQETYVKLRDFYKNQYAELLKVLEGRIDSLSVDESVRKNLKNELLAKMLEASKLEPYFPLTRKGTYFLAVKEKKGGRNSAVFSYESNGERQEAMEFFDGEGLEVDIFDPNDKSNYNGDSVPPAFVSEVLDILNQQPNVDAETKEQITRLFIQALPESSFAKGLQRRKKTEGFDKDAFEAVRTKGYDLARQTVRIKNSALIGSYIETFKANAKIGKYDQVLVDEVVDRGQFSINPPVDNYAKMANRAAFLFTIGFNASSALVNLSQIPLFAYPMLAGRYGYKEANAAFKDAAILFVNTPFSQTQQTIFGDARAPRSVRAALKGNNKLKDALTALQDKAQPSLDNYYTVTRSSNGKRLYTVREDLNLSKDQITQLNSIKPLVELSARRGQLGTSFIAETLSVDSSGRNISKMDWITNQSALMFHNAEVMNRQVTLMAAYNLALNKALKGKGTVSPTERAAAEAAAAEEAVFETTQINGGANLETGPRFARSGIGRVILMYKNYGITMYYKMLKTAWQGAKAQYNGDTKEARVAFKQLAGIHVSVLLLAGVQGMPLFGLISSIVDTFFTDDDEEDFETYVRKALNSNTLYKGALSEITGLDVSKRVALTNLLVEADRFNADPSPEETIAHYFGGPATSVGIRVYEGFGEIFSADGDGERGFESILPGAFRNAYRALYRYPRDDGMLTRRGDAMYEDVSSGELFAQFLGFPPTEYMNRMEESSKAKRMDDAAFSKRSKLLKRFYVAMRFGDSEAVKEAMDDMMKFNSSSAAKANAKLFINNKTIRRSLKSHQRTTLLMHNGVLLSSAMKSAVESEGFF